MSKDRKMILCLKVGLAACVDVSFTASGYVAPASLTEVDMVVARLFED